MKGYSLHAPADLTKYNDIVIQCHDNPDPDAVASGFARYRFFSADPGRRVRFVYTGQYRIQKPNSRMMTKRSFDSVGICRKPAGGSGIAPYRRRAVWRRKCHAAPGGRIAVIDHHPDSGRMFDHAESRSAYGSCATLVYHLLIESAMM
jgi:phosphoglycolate phosphatase